MVGCEYAYHKLDHHKLAYYLDAIAYHSQLDIEPEYHWRGVGLYLW